MKSWVNVEADVNKIMQKHFTPGRTAKINKIVIHHNAGNLTTEDCYRAWQTREASAHYQVEITGRIGQLVWDENTAWHATGANANGIGIEHANNKMGPYWTISDATLENGAHLVAALCRYHKLGRPQWRKNVFPHLDFNATACPGAIWGNKYASQRDKYMSRAQYWYDVMSKTAPGTTTQKPTTPTKKFKKIDVDGRFGSDTAKGAQYAFGTPVDGKVSSQSLSWKSKYADILTTGWEWVAPSRAVGSQLIIKIQTWAGIAAKNRDGLAGPALFKALKTKTKTKTDKDAIKALQKEINRRNGW